MEYVFITLGIVAVFFILFECCYFIWRKERLKVIALQEKLEALKKCD